MHCITMHQYPPKLRADHPNTPTSMAAWRSWCQRTRTVATGQWEEAEKPEVQVMETCKTKRGANYSNTAP
jgi:hypothetical protein